jgi:hypothetical protein
MLSAVSWFDGDAPRDDAEAAFLGELRALSADWGLDVRPEQTGVLAALVPLYVEVEVPGLPRGANKSTVLQSGYWAQSPTGLVVQAEWGDTHLLDNGGHDDDLSVGGVNLEPGEAASLLAAWFASQLRRPVQHAEWLGAAGETLAAEWRLGDTGRRLASDGSWLRRRRAPSRVKAVRPAT